MNELSILQCPCAAVTSEAEFRGELEHMLEDGLNGYSVAINATKIVMYADSKLVKDLIDHAAVKTPDGFGVVLGARLLHNTRVVKINFPELVLKTCQDLRLKLFVLGATEASNSKACDAISRRFPAIRLVGRQNGYFEDSEEVLQVILKAQPHVVLIGMGSPRQESLSASFMKSTQSCFFVGCGGALDVLADKVKRAPDIFVDNGLEWLYRLVRQPSRLYIQRHLVRFLLRLVVECVRKRVVGI